jgi:HlyD family secretion protein
LVREDGTVEEREVGTGISNDLYIEIVDGLSEGDIVVANPGENLKSGQKVIVNDKP